ncbi:hypothetical protein SCLCIDRAFT_10275 [Scleroderma citrinum Foug A]|uniref:Uncharacterized protein n=1 Tax=Scleroderma citrinum Foug A TaxID=1036808 RepID=A0A0C3DQL5_9AGAM|nr:hypothetical protein SCLCIDRAFT_10275 [Scleroderma citrinum Foug A]
MPGPAPHQCGAEAHDKPSVPRIRAHRPPQCYHDNSDSTREPNNPPIPTAEVPNPAVRQTHHRQTVDSAQDTEYFDIDNHSEVDEDDNDDDNNGAEGVKRPIPRARAPQRQALPSPMDTVNSINPLESIDKGSNTAQDINNFFERSPEGSTCRRCR